MELMVNALQYMAEISPPEIRGSLMALEQYAIVLGVIVGFWLGYFTRASACTYLAELAESNSHSR